jgi:hypothetical protein
VTKEFRNKKHKVHFWDLEDKGNAKGAPSNRFEK